MTNIIAVVECGIFPLQLYTCIMEFKSTGSPHEKVVNLTQRSMNGKLRLKNST